MESEDAKYSIAKYLNKWIASNADNFIRKQRPLDASEVKKALRLKPHQS